MKLQVLEYKLSIVRLSAGEAIPAWAMTSEFFSISKTKDELSIVCDAMVVPQDVLIQNHGWKCIQVVGPLDFALTGILSELAQPLAQANVSIFAISTYDTDYLLVKMDTLDKTIEVLASEGHQFV